jgi:PBP1b-binding outer membrane lipoprotein LpoB
MKKRLLIFALVTIFALIAASCVAPAPPQQQKP